MTLRDSQSEPGSKREQEDRQTEAANGAARDGEGPRSGGEDAKGQKTQVKPEAGG